MSEVTNYPENSPQQPVPWDPFQLMDRLDEEALRKELDGIAGTDLVYVVREGGQEIVGLSKTGVDECCMALVSQGQAIREEDLHYEVLGDGEDREALFTVKSRAVRDFAHGPGGPARSGHRREAAATLHARPSVEPPLVRAGRDEGRAERPVPASSPGWYGRRSSAARASRDIPGSSTRRAAQSNVPAPQPATPTSARTEVASRVGPYAPTEKQVAFYQRLADSPVFTDEERRRALDWLAGKATRPDDQRPDRLAETAGRDPSDATRRRVGRLADTLHHPAVHFTSIPRRPSGLLQRPEAAAAHDSPLAPSSTTTSAAGPCGPLSAYEHVGSQVHH